MADPPQPGNGDVGGEQFVGERDFEARTEVLTEDDSMEDITESVGDDDEDDESYVAEDGSDSMNISSSEDNESYEEEELDMEAEIRALQAENAEEERRARGGWTDETADAFRKELKQEWESRKNKVKNQQASVQDGSAVHGRAQLQILSSERADGSRRKDPVKDQERRTSVMQSAVAADVEAARVSQQQHILAGTRFTGAADAKSSRVSEDVLNLPRLTSECSLHADMAGTVFVAADMLREEKSIAADMGENLAMKGVPHAAKMASGYSHHTDMAGAEIVACQLEGSGFGGPTCCMQAAGAIPARPVMAISAEEAGLMDLYAAQPLKAHPDAEPGIFMAQPVAAHTPVLGCPQPNSNVEGTAAAPETQPIHPRPIKTLNPDRGRKPTAAAEKTTNKPAITPQPIRDLTPPDCLLP